MNNKMFFTIVSVFLVQIVGSLSSQLKSDFNANNVALDDQVLEIKKEISGGGIIDLIDGTTERVDGICNYDKDRLKTGRAFVFDRVALNYKNSTSTSTDPNLPGTLSYDAILPDALQNAVLIITQEGREVLRMPVRDVANIETGQKISDEYTELDSLRYFADEREIKLQIKFPPSATLPTAGGVRHFVYLRLRGLQTTKKPTV